MREQVELQCRRSLGSRNGKKGKEEPDKKYSMSVDRVRSCLRWSEHGSFAHSADPSDGPSPPLVFRYPFTLRRWPKQPPPLHHHQIIVPGFCTCLKNHVVLAKTNPFLRPPFFFLGIHLEVSLSVIKGVRFFFFSTGRIWFRLHRQKHHFCDDNILSTFLISWPLFSPNHQHHQFTKPQNPPKKKKENREESCFPDTHLSNISYRILKSCL